MTRKISTTVYLDPKQVRALAALSQKTRVPQAVLIREALDAYLEKRRDEIPPKQPDPRQLQLPATYPHCQAARDGECHWEHCPQLRDGEPYASGRHCPLDTDEE